MVNTIFEKAQIMLRNVDSYSKNKNLHLQKCKYLKYWLVNGIEHENRTYYIHIDFYIHFLRTKQLEKSLLKLTERKPFPDKFLESLLSKIKLKTKESKLEYVLTNNLEYFKKSILEIYSQHQLKLLLKKIRLNYFEKLIEFYLIN